MILNKTKATVAITIFMLVCMLITSLVADTRIVMYLEPPPADVLAAVAQNVKDDEKLKADFDMLEKQTPAEVSKTMVKNGLRSRLLPKVSGFIALYGGYVDYSDTDGQITFPLRHDISRLYVALTPRIELVRVQGHTVSHAQYVDSNNNPTELYQLDVETDENKQQRWWKVQQVHLPENKQISPITVTILTDPKNLYIEQGNFFIENETKQLILPRIFVVGNVQTEAQILASLDITRYFEQITRKKQKSGETIIQDNINNI
ncbi:MAG: hypothetical protein H6679_05010 [Epsilonproteobacteria bacterium]|nr:hypothetical protein [Campylobacterota bacterium]